MNIATTIITCPDRAEMLQATAASLDQTDWPFPPVIVMDEAPPGRPEEKQERNSLRALQLALAARPDFILFLEDDLQFNSHLHHNLMSWRPFKERWFGMASLYNPNIRELSRCDGEHWFIADPNAVYGSQAYLLTPECAEFVVANWSDCTGMQDIKISRLTAASGRAIYYHAPSLVQHVGSKSSWGTSYFHQTADYAPEFKA